MVSTIEVADRGRRIAFSFAHLLKLDPDPPCERRERATTLVLRDGFVSDQCSDPARTDDRSAEQDRRLDRLTRELADRVLARPASEVYDGEGLA